MVIVGNLVAGGAGKTPTVIALTRGLTERGHQVGLLARGYRSPDQPGAATVHLIPAGQPRPAPHGTASTVAGPGADHGSTGSTGSTGSASDLPGADVVGDEALVLARATGVPIAVGADRAAALSLLLDANPGLTIVISDDGLQHTGLARAIELVIIDERGFGNGRCLPAGPLREPVDRLATVDAVLLHRRDSVPDGVPAPRAIFHLETAIGSFATLDGSQRWSPQAFVDVVGEGAEGSASGRSRPLPALAAIARPERFFDDLRALGLQIEPWPLPDHATIDPGLLARLAGRTIVMTAKDAVKLAPDPSGAGPRIIIAEQTGRLDPALLNWLASA